MSFQAGYQNRIFWKANGSAAYTTLCDFRHEFSEQDEGHEVTSSCHNGVQAFIASVLRGEGTASFHIDTAQLPWSLGIVAQAIGMIRQEYGNRSVMEIPVYISRVNYTNETAAGTDYNVTFKLNAEAGTFARPS